MRIAIVNDMSMAVEAMRRALLRGPGLEVAWIARDGAEAVRRCSSDRPDLVLMDLVMPLMDGIEATRRIMAATPCPIVVVTGSVGRNSSKVFEAMSAGALDAVSTPSFAKSGASSEGDPFLDKIETINRLIRHSKKHKPAKTAMHHKARPKLVAIGSSSGGPAALARILSKLPEDFPAAVLVVQHVDPRLANDLADWLGRQTKLKVRVAQDDDKLHPGTVLLAGADQHLKLIGRSRLGHSAEPSDTSYRPSIDVCFESIREFWPGDVIGVLLTGMGSDGAQGLMSLRQTGHHTIAQDAESSAVYGMPRAAAEAGAATQVLPLDEIAERLMRLVHLPERRRKTM
jgi:chemotaxis response regulator CheB